MLTVPRALIAVLASAIALGLVVLPGPWLIRFSFDPLNYWFAAMAAFAVPLSVALVARAVRSVWSGALLYLAALALAIPLVPFGAIALLESNNTQDGKHLSRIPLSEVSRHGSTFRLYRTDCGATCAYGLELRREIELLGVVKLASPLWSKYREDHADLHLLADGQVTVVQGELVLYSFRE